MLASFNLGRQTLNMRKDKYMYVDITVVSLAFKDLSNIPMVTYVTLVLRV